MSAEPLTHLGDALSTVSPQDGFLESEWYRYAKEDDDGPENRARRAQLRDPPGDQG